MSEIVSATVATNRPEDAGDSDNASPPVFINTPAVV
jgi:hypothetical protein